MKVLSLFSGCGGLDLGLTRSGHEIVYASDIDQDCVKTYEHNIGEIHLEDVKDINCKQLPKYDLLVGGFPCQGFSIANLYRHEKDERNELYLQIVRILNETRPKYFLAENVPGILNLASGKIAQIIEKEFSEIGKNEGFKGYDVKKYVLNAANYGVPQNRRRVIFLGISKKIDEYSRNVFFKNFPPPITNSKDQSTGLPKLKSLRDAIGDLPDIGSKKSKGILNHISTKHKVKINGYIGNRKLDWEMPSPTIVGRGGGTGGPVIAVHPNLKRRFSVRETARIQTFPDDFEFFGSTSSQYRQIGNAVAVDFAYHIGKFFKKFEEKKYKEFKTKDIIIKQDSLFG